MSTEKLNKIFAFLACVSVIFMMGCFLIAIKTKCNDIVGKFDRVNERINVLTRSHNELIINFQDHVHERAVFNKVLVWRKQI